MGKKQLLKSLPPGDYEVSKPEVLKELPAGDYEVSTPQKSSGIDYSLITGQAGDSEKLENVLDGLVSSAKGTVLDSERDLLRDVLSNPNTTPEQAREAIQTVQGYHQKFKESEDPDKTSYYLKREENGVIVPKPLAYGERPPKGYDVASVWGSQKEANDDAWYTDLAKSVYNGLLGGVEGVADLVQMGTILATGEESKMLNSATNAINSLKFKKDEDLDKPIFDTEGVTEWSDLLDKDRFDLSPQAIWGTLNMTAESAATFLSGAGAAGQFAKGVQGVKKLNQLSKSAQNVSAFTGSFLTMAGDNIDAAKEAGLEGRDVGAYALAVTSMQSAVDAKFGILPNIYKGAFKKTEKEILKQFAKEAEKDAAGMLTEKGFKEAVKNTTLAYESSLANAIKQGVVAAGKEGLQEVSQDAIEKASQQIYDALDGESKAKFGTNASSPEAFASYIQNFMAGVVGGGAMAPASIDYKKKYNEQSVDALKIVEGGKDSVDEFKANVYQAARRGDITEQERDRAVFKVDQYNKYNEQIKDFPNMSKEDKRNAFEMSFNIEALKAETEFTQEELKQLDPISIAKIDSKKELIKGLQKDLNSLLLRQELPKETKVGESTVNKVAKEVEPPKEGEVEKPTLEDVLKRLNPEVTQTDEINFDEEEQSASAQKKPYKRFAYDRESTPDFDAKDENGTYEFNKLTDPISKQRALRDYLDARPELDNEMEGIVLQSQNNVWQVDLGDGRFVQFARSIKPEEFIGDTKGLPKDSQIEEYKDSDGRTMTKYKQPVVVKLQEIVGDKEGRKGQRLRVLNVYNKRTGKYIVSIKEKQKGNSNYSEAELKQLNEIQSKGLPPKDVQPKVDYNKLVESAVSERELDAITDQATQANQYSPELLEAISAKRESLSKTKEKAEPKPKEESKPEKKPVKERPVVSEAERELTEQEVQEELSKLDAREQAELAGYYQRTSDVKGDVKKVLDRIKKVMPKVNVVVDESLNAAGKVQGNTLTINPYFAGKDTPIHEAGHILIDAIGYNNKVIQRAIKQLKGTELWDSVKERYPELDEEGLGKEVLAEAIGREGAGIFDKSADRSKFKVFLDYILDWLKTKLGINKNIAKSLANQIIGGYKTKELTGTNERSQLAKKKSSYDQAVKANMDKILATDDLMKYSYNQLIDAYNDVQFMDDASDRNRYQKQLNTRIALHVDMLRRMEIMKDEKLSKSFDEGAAATQDIDAFTDVKFKVLSHFTENFPALQYLSFLWDNAWFNKMTEAREKKSTHEKLGRAVIKERNKKLGLKERLGNLIISDNSKYFDFIDDGKGKIITLDEAKKKGLSEAQINYLTYVRKELAERMKLVEGQDILNMDMDVLKMDKGIYETYKSDGLVQAFGNWMGHTNRIANVRVSFLNPLTNKTEITEFKNIEKILSEYGKKGMAEKSKAIRSLAKYNRKARKQFKLGRNEDQTLTENILVIPKGGDYTLDENGQLRSKFGRKRDADRGYSKDFYGTMSEYIDDSMHIKYISPLIPVINAIEYLNETGVVDADGNQVIAKKPNVVKWMKEWQDLHVLQKPDENNIDIDASLRFLRFMSSMTTMLFNVPANIMNLSIGLYNNWVADNSKDFRTGLKRLFIGPRDFSKESGYGILNKYASDIIRKYVAVSTDKDSNPTITAGSFFTEMGFALQKYGEFIIQGAGMLGKLDEKDYNAFKYEKNKYGIDELVVKDKSREEEIKRTILSKINEVSDVQGKYSDKDKRNIMNNELGKAVMQYKVWIPDWLRVRFGDKGSYRTLMRGGFEELRKDIEEKGVKKAFWENKAFMKSFKEMMFATALMSLLYTDDEDKKKSDLAKLAQRGLSDILFIFDPDNLKFTISRPVASIDILLKFIDTADHLFAVEESDYNKDGSAKVLKDIGNFIPGKKKLDQAVEFLSEDE